MLEREIYFLATLAEEGGEVAQMAGKAIRFGLDAEKRARLVEELTDVIVAARALGIEVNPARVEKKSKMHEDHLAGRPVVR
jgi:NTP pyrophosphatase (non-canonical NTP hydrolase)